ncbi:TetR/AcrR family transcriptional regulator [Oenococcus sp. UCMA 16435]|nr:TetR/AcrR family transcriptional regulator [Oenococcus sp. UCMA 16435]
MNKKSARTKQQAEDALFQLMQQKKFDTISITEITDAAKISRMAFYRNYKTKEDVLNNFIQKEYDRFIEDISEHDLNQLDQLLNVYFTYFQQNPQIILSISNAGIEGTALEQQTNYLKEFFKGKVQDGQQPSLYEISYYSGAIFSVLLYWSQTNYAMSIHEITGRLVEKITKDFDTSDEFIF